MEFSNHKESLVNSTKNIEVEISQKRNYQQLSIFLMIYFTQGLINGYFLSSLAVLLQMNKASWTKLGLLSISNYTFIFDFLVVPLIDKYYVKTIGIFIFYNHNFKGKRKTYIIPTQIFISCLLLVLVFMIDDLIQDLDIYTLVAIAFSINLIQGIQNISLDGWQITSLSNNYYALGIAMIMIGRNMGTLVSNNLFLYLQDNYNLTSSKFLFFVMLLNFFNCLIVIFTNETRNYKNRKNIIQNYKDLSIFFKNKTLFYVIMLEFTWHFGYSAIESNIHLRMFKAGFSKKNYLLIGLLITPLQIFAALFIGFKIKKYQELSVYWKFWIIRLIQNFLQFWVVYFINKDNSDSFYIASCIFVTEAMSKIANYGCIGLSTWLNRVSKKEIGATFVTTFVLVGSLGKNWTETFWLFIGQTEQFLIMAISGWTFTIIFILVNVKQLNKIQEFDQQDIYQKN